MLARAAAVLQYDAVGLYNKMMYGTRAVSELSSAEKIIRFIDVGGKNILIFIIVAIALYKLKDFIADHVFPRLSLAWKNIRSGAPLALATFKNTDG